MTSARFDKDGYPAEEWLELLREAPPEEVLSMARDAWNMDYGTIRREHDSEFGNGELVCFVTGGWSGNEQILHHMELNFVFWSLHWYSSYRGGLHKFTL